VSGYQLPSTLSQSLDALRTDLLADGGPQITTVRNYNFAILPYPAENEFDVRRAIQRLSGDLQDAGWRTGTVPLHSLLLARLRREGPEFVEAMIGREKRLANAKDPWRGLRDLKEKVVNLVEGPEGLARDVIDAIDRILTDNPDGADRTVIFLGRAGALYPFLRTSALLKHLAGKTRNAPVILLYPGTVSGDAGLSFMGVLPADRDYRPRIYR
jgi:hypothetical protein